MWVYPQDHTPLRLCRKRDGKRPPNTGGQAV
uniref:Uncharacterized protein n=1 Tax=Anguilla anguilla TaxID=7936 RepID=A0A0E9Q1Y1_ANGAN